MGSGLPTPLAVVALVLALAQPIDAAGNRGADGDQGQTQTAADRTLDLDTAIARLRAEFPGIVLGVLHVTIGLVALLACSMPRIPSRGLLASFGVLVLLFGIRLLAGSDVVQVTVPGPGRFWDYVVAGITYFIPIPAFLFVDLLLGSGWKQSVRRIWQVHFLYAVPAFSFDLFTGRPYAAMGPNGPIVVTWIVIALLNVLAGQFPHAVPRVLRVGFGAFAVLVLHDNLRGVGLLPWSVALEPIGSIGLVLCLGYVLVERLFQSERRLGVLEEELATARRIQASLLPTELPRIRGTQVAVRYLPMTAVGGDFYEFLPLDDDRFGVLVADVTGHGVSAALMASMVKVATAAQLAHAADPARLLAGVNQVLCGRLGPGHFVTAVYAHLDLAGRRLTIASAGHPAALVVHPDEGIVREVGAPGLLLGFVPEVSYENVVVPLRLGERLVLYTDGLIEAMNPAGELLDRSRVEADLRVHARGSAEALAERLLERVRQWTCRAEASFDDDLTLVIVELADDAAGPRAAA